VSLQIREGTNDRGICTEVLTRDTYKMASRSFGPGDLLVDIGAHIGTFVAWSAHLFPGARIEAFEMDDGNFEILQRNAAGLEHAAIHHMAVVGEVVPAGYKRNVKNGGGHHIQFRRPERPLPGAITLAEIIRLHGDIAFLKLDCEGAEHFILRKAAQDGVLGRVAAMALEYHNFFKESGDALADLLREHFDLVEMRVQNRSCGIIKASRNATG